jgi:hypothetical protein
LIPYTKNEMQRYKQKLIFMTNWQKKNKLRVLLNIFLSIILAIFKATSVRRFAYWFTNSRAAVVNDSKVSEENSKRSCDTESKERSLYETDEY